MTSQSHEEAAERIVRHTFGVFGIAVHSASADKHKRLLKALAFEVSTALSLSEKEEIGRL